MLDVLADLPAKDFWQALIGTLAGFLSLCCLDVLHAKLRYGAHERPGPSFLIDIIYWFLNPAVRVVSRFATISVLLLIGLLIGEWAIPAMLHGFGPVVRQPKLLIVVELFVVTDLASYWSHRLCHTVPFLWRFHAVHHSTTEVRWWSTARLHPVNDVVTYSFNILPCAALGFPLDGLAPVVPMIAAWAVYLHSESNVTFGFLRKVITSPRFHRWHHTLTHEGGNKNFSGAFALWDVLFGTYYMPMDRLPERFGIDANDVPESFRGQLAYPWRRS